MNSEPEVGAELRAQVLQQSGYSEEEIKQIEQVIMGGHTATRGADTTKEVKALSDADTLFKALPITPILFASKYIQQNKVDINKLAHKVVSEQKPLLEQDIYFYTEIAKQKYLHWAKVNLDLWVNVQEALGDEDVQYLIETARQKNII